MGWSWFEGASTVAFLTLAVSILIAAWAIRPRLWNQQHRGFVFWESILGHDSADAYWKALQAQPKSDLAEHLAHHLYAIARVARSKYRWVGISLWLAIGGGVAGAVLMMMR
jgi:hypothetical protein